MYFVVAFGRRASAGEEIATVYCMDMLSVDLINCKLVRAPVRPHRRQSRLAPPGAARRLFCSFVVLQDKADS